MRVQIAFATSETMSQLDDELPLLVDAATKRGHQAEVCSWDDPAVDWNSFDKVVVRSCWDYTGRRDQFVNWARSIPGLQNPPHVIEWNTDKVYLREFAASGTPIIETYWNVEAGDEIGAHDEWVCKPSISGGSRDTARWGTREEVYAHSAELMSTGRTSMVQPYIKSVDSDGETAMIFLGGEFSHAIRKGQLLHKGEGARQDRDSRESITPRAPTAAQHEVAAESLASVADILALEEPLLYARVDLVTAENGSPLVIELELTEPSLFLAHGNEAADRLVSALEA
jgi:glutathione synthase/RimK-type ligase-like ATP-grasp enzyme